MSTLLIECWTCATTASPRAQRIIIHPCKTSFSLMLWSPHTAPNAPAPVVCIYARGKHLPVHLTSRPADNACCLGTYYNQLLVPASIPLALAHPVRRCATHLYLCLGWIPAPRICLNFFCWFLEYADMRLPLVPIPLTFSLCCLLEPGMNDSYA